MTPVLVQQHVFVWLRRARKCILCARLSEPAAFCHTLLIWSLKDLHLKLDTLLQMQTYSIHLQHKRTLTDIHSTHINAGKTAICIKMANAYLYKVFLSTDCNKVSTLLSSSLYSQIITLLTSPTNYSKRYNSSFTWGGSSSSSLQSTYPIQFHWMGYLVQHLDLDLSHTKH